MSKRNIIQIDLSGCKNWKECEIAIALITSGKINITIESYEKRRLY
jgi:hypothetical protein